MYEPPSLSLGFPLPPGTWPPQFDASIPEKCHAPFSTQWITSYFDHGNLSTRDTDVLHIVSSVSHRPSIYTMSDERSGGFVQCKMIPGMSNLMHTSDINPRTKHRRDPEKAAQAYFEALA
ncbi:uncharacterized protein B0H18DRAFT_1115071 [Fomitopsis serialis]|uniref:uncharacterized protein n=1 Tax=Fomitopsis serialis TaxID=139415 RepID=UPI0020087DC2|nr:uncharacterized protein B0H18DRAFT_1115071 [Neoantrodia serialis]KAH9934361.1 hypothetical protein B0H18DRAFT_1115071 [Neoantrodia serialis]